MARLMTIRPVRELVYYGVLAGLAIALTHVFYLQVNGLV